MFSLPPDPLTDLTSEFRFKPSTSYYPLNRPRPDEIVNSSFTNHLRYFYRRHHAAQNVSDSLCFPPILRLYRSCCLRQGSDMWPRTAIHGKHQTAGGADSPQIFGDVLLSSQLWAVMLHPRGAKAQLGSILLTSITPPVSGMRSRDKRCPVELRGLCLTFLWNVIHFLVG